MNIWVIEAEVNGKYEPIAMEYSRDQARYAQKQLKLRHSIMWNENQKSRIRKYIQDPTSRG